MKIAVLPKTIYKFIVIPIKISMPFFIFLKKTLTISIEAKKIHKTILSLRNAAEDDRKKTQVILRGIGIKIAWY